MNVTDPKVVAADEKLKQTANLVELVTAASTYNTFNADRTLNIPVCTVLGKQDPFLCGLTAVSCTTSTDLAKFERPFYGPRAKVEAYLVPNTGHNLQLEKNAPRTNNRMLDFSDKYIGAGSGVKNSSPGSAAPAGNLSKPSTSLTGNITNIAVNRALIPLVTLIQKTSNVVPGLGSNQDPIPPGVLSRAVSTCGNLVDSLVGTAPEDASGS